MSPEGRWPNPRAQPNRFSTSQSQGNQLSDTQIARLSAWGKRLFSDEDAQWISDVLDSAVVHTTRASLCASVKGIFEARKMRMKMRMNTNTSTNTNMSRLISNGHAALQAYHQQSQSRVMARKRQRNEAESNPTFCTTDYSMHNATNLP